METAFGVENTGDESSPAPCPYDQIKNQCEDLVTGKQHKMSLLQSFKEQHEALASSNHDHNISKNVRILNIFLHMRCFHHKDTKVVFGIMEIGTEWFHLNKKKFVLSEEMEQIKQLLFISPISFNSIKPNNKHSWLGQILQFLFHPKRWDIVKLCAKDVNALIIENSPRVFVPFNKHSRLEH